MELAAQGGARSFLSSDPGYGGSVSTACGHATCYFRLNISTSTPIPVNVTGMQGTLLVTDQDQHDHLDATGTFRMYGFYLDASMQPALLTMSPVIFATVYMNMFVCTAVACPKFQSSLFR